MLRGDLNGGMWGEIKACILSSPAKEGEKNDTQICLGEGGCAEHSYKVAVGTVKAVFHERVHMLTALRFRSVFLTASLEKKTQSNRLSLPSLWKLKEKSVSG